MGVHSHKLCETTGDLWDRSALLPFLQSLADTLEADAALFGVVDRSGGVVRIIEHFGIANGREANLIIRNPPIGECLTGLAASSGVPQEFPDLERDQRVSSAFLKKRPHLKACVSHPLGDKCEPVGVLTLYWTKPHQMDSHQRRILESYTHVLQLLRMDPMKLLFFVAVQTLLINTRLDGMSCPAEPASGRPRSANQPPAEQTIRVPGYMRELFETGRDKVARLREQRDLYNTLRVHLTCNSVKESLDHLYIHVNTLRYRLRKIEGACGVDLRNPYHRLMLMLGILYHDGPDGCTPPAAEPPGAHVSQLPR